MDNGRPKATVKAISTAQNGRRETRNRHRSAQNCAKASTGCAFAMYIPSALKRMDLPRLAGSVATRFGRPEFVMPLTDSGPPESDQIRSMAKSSGEPSSRFVPIDGCSFQLRGRSILMHTPAPFIDLPDSQSPGEPWTQSFKYTQSLEQVKQSALSAIRLWYPSRGSNELDLSRFEACVAIKNYEGVIVAENRAMRRFFTGGLPAIGRGADAFAFRPMASMTQSSDRLIRDGANAMEFEHISCDPSGRHLAFRSAMFRLAELNDPGYFILAMSRPLAVVDSSPCERTLAELFLLFQRLDDIDQAICRYDAHGDTTKEIAAGVGLSSRSVEVRRKKMLEIFGVRRPMELVRITIRLEEHGLLL